MGFDAGAITATLELDDQPFLDTLAKDEALAKEFERSPIVKKVIVDSRGLTDGIAEAAASGQEAATANPITVPSRVEALGRRDLLNSLQDMIEAAQDATRDRGAAVRIPIQMPNPEVLASDVAQVVERSQVPIFDALVYSPAAKRFIDYQLPQFVSQFSLPMARALNQALADAYELPVGAQPPLLSTVLYDLSHSELASRGVRIARQELSQLVPVINRLSDAFGGLPQPMQWAIASGAWSDYAASIGEQASGGSSWLGDRSGGAYRLGSPNWSFGPQGELGPGPGTSILPWWRYGSGVYEQTAGPSGPGDAGPGWWTSYEGMKSHLGGLGLIRDKQGGFSPMGLFRFLQDSGPGVALSNMFGSQGGLAGMLGGASGLPLIGSMPIFAALPLVVGALSLASTLGIAAGAGIGGLISAGTIGGAGLLAGGYGAYSAYHTIAGSMNARANLNSQLAQLRAAGIGPSSPLWQNAITRFQNARADPQANAAADALRGLTNAVHGVTQGLTHGWMPALGAFFRQLTHFITMPAVHGFLANAQKGGQDILRYFGGILNSGATRHDMGVFSKDVRPMEAGIGKAVGNLFQGFLNFAAAFAPLGLQILGMIDRWTGGVAKFFQHFHLGKGTIDTIMGVFHDLGSIIGSIAGIGAKLIPALMPIGKVILDIITYVIKAAAWFVKLIPPPLLTALGVLMIVLPIIAALLLGLVSTGAIVAVALVALAVGIYALATHWKQVWTNIKNWAVNAWHWIENDVFKPITHAWDALTRFLARVWGAIWNTMKSVVLAVWHWFDQSIIQPLKRGWQTLVTGISTAWSIAWNSVKSIVTTAWQWIDNNIIHPIGHILSTMWNGLVSGVRVAVSIAKGILAGLKATIDTIAAALNALNPLSKPTPAGFGPGTTHPGGAWAPGPIGGTTGTPGTHPLALSLGPANASTTTMHFHITVDARGSSSLAETTEAARRGVTAALTAALNRGALRTA